MLDFIAQNISTIGIAAAVFAIVALAFVSVVRKKSCGGDCGGCDKNRSAQLKSKCDCERRNQP